LTQVQIADARASVDRLLEAMGAENERRRNWHSQPVEGWRDGRLTIRSVIDGETTVVNFRKPRGPAA
jgi:hypothetical protein